MTRAIVYYQKFILRDDLKANPRFLFVFGDNCQRDGFGGQAKEMRKEPNAFGIVTKWDMYHNQNSYFKDSDFDVSTKNLIDEDFENLKKEMTTGYYLGIVIPIDGIGTGLAKLSENAPNTLLYIERKFTELKGWL